MHVTGIILAAGASSRLGRPKQLLDLGGEPALRHVIRTALDSRLTEIVVVLGNEAEIVKEVVGEFGQRTAINPRFAEGQSTSLGVGIEAAHADADAAMLLLGDQPLLQAETVNLVLAAYSASNAPIVQARRNGQPGHPVIIRSELFPELLTLTGDEGARSVIRRYADRIHYIEVPNVDEALDLDTEADFKRVQDAWARRGERVR